MTQLHSQEQWLARARAVLPAASLGNFSADIVLARGAGSRVWDEDGKEYVDYLIGSGPMLLGHGHPEVLEAVFEQLPQGMTFFANNSKAIELAEVICAATACAEQVRFLTSGGEADMYAMRLARAYTGRDRIVKFEGGYHGMSAEAQMSLAPQRQLDFPRPLPDSAGIPQSVAEQVLVAPFNDLAYISGLLDEYSDIAAVIVEPLQRIIPAQPGFLAGLRQLCDKHGILLVFDEVVTGFRLAYGGAQELYDVVPDICTLGKVIGGGFPLAAIAASSEIMRYFDKSAVGADNWLMQLGTLSGNPLAAVAGLKTLEILRRPGSYERLRAIGTELMAMQSEACQQAGIAHQVVGDPTLFNLMFTDVPCSDYRNTQHQSAARDKSYNASLRAQGVFKSPSKMYPSLALTEADLALTRAAVQQAVAGIAELS